MARQEMSAPDPARALSALGRWLALPTYQREEAARAAASLGQAREFADWLAEKPSTALVLRGDREVQDLDDAKAEIEELRAEITEIIGWINDAPEAPELEGSRFDLLLDLVEGLR